MKYATAEPKVRLVLKARGEKIAFGAAVTLLAGYLAIATLFPRREPAIPLLPESPIASKTLAPPKAVDFTKLALDAYNAPIPTPSADPWIASYPTVADVKVIEGPGEPSPLIHSVGHVVKVQSTVEPGKVTVTFAFQPASGANVVDAPVTSYIIERKDGAGPWKVLEIKVDPTASGFTDDSVEAKTSYIYRITPVTSDAKVDKDSIVAKEIPVKSADIWTFTLKQVFPDKKEEGRGSIDIGISKYVKSAGRSFESRFLVHDDATLGEHRVGFDSDGKSVRQFSDGKKLIPVDFDCGYDLESIKVLDLKARRVTLVSRADPKVKIVLAYP